MTAILDAILDLLNAPGYCPGLLVYFTHISGAILKMSAYYEKCPAFITF